MSDLPHNIKPFSRWKIAKTHLRNIDISISVAKGLTYVQASKLFGISKTRVSQIYRVLMAYICVNTFDVEWNKAVHDKKYYKHPDSLKMLERYKSSYNNSINNND